MNQRYIHNFIWIPIFIIGFGNVCFGLVWLLYPEPWMLDQIPNEVLIRTSFDTLFSVEINTYLPDYLKVIYRFFGWWIITIGLLIIIYVQITKMGTYVARNLILGVLLFVLIGIIYMVYIFIPKSPFKLILVLQATFWFISAYSSTLIKE